MPRFCLLFAVCVALAAIVAMAGTITPDLA